MTESRDASHYIRRLREQKYPRQQVKAAQDAGVSQPYLSQLETGKRGLTAQAALRIERGWNLERYELLRWVGDEPGNDLRSASGTNPGYVCRLIANPFPNVGRPTTFLHTGRNVRSMLAVPA